MSSAKPGKVDEIHEARKRSSEELTSQRQKAVVDANATDARTQNWTQYSDQNHHYGPPVTARQINNTNPDGTYARDKAPPPYADPLMLYPGILPPHIDPRILITGSTNNKLNLSTSGSFQIQNNTPAPSSMAYPVTMEPYGTYALPVMIDHRFNTTRDNRPDPMSSPFNSQLLPNNAVFPAPYLSQKGHLQDVDRSTSDIFANKRNQLRAEFLSRSNPTDPGSSEPNTSDRPDSANTNSSNPESGNDLEDEEDELTGKRRPILKSNEDRRVHHKLVEQERRKTMNKYTNRLRELMDIPAPTKGRGLKKSIVLEKACEYVDKIHDYVATLYNANQQLTNALNLRGVTPQMMAQFNIPFVPPPPSHIYPPSNYRAPQYVNSSQMNQRADPHNGRAPTAIAYPSYFKPEMHGQLIEQPFQPHLENPLNSNGNPPNPFNANLNVQPTNPNNFNNNAHSSFSEKHTEP